MEFTIVSKGLSQPTETPVPLIDMKEGQEMQHKVDPAALLIAVFVAGAGPLFEPGEWDYTTTVTGAIILIVVIAFTWPTRRSGRLSWAMILAFSSVYAFVIAILASWPAQRRAESRFAANVCPDPANASTFLDYMKATDCIERRSGDLAQSGTMGGMIVGAFVFVILAGWWGWQRRSVARPSAQEIGTESA